MSAAEPYNLYVQAYEGVCFTKMELNQIFHVSRIWMLSFVQPDLITTMRETARMTAESSMITSNTN